MASSSALGLAEVPADVLIVNNNEINVVSLVSELLSGRENYVTWRKYMEIALSARSKLEFVYGKYIKPIEPVAALKWQRCNDAVMTWLLNSTVKEVQEQIVQAENVTVAWNILEQRFGGSNVSRKFALEQEIACLMQGDLEVGKYFNRLINLWHKLDAMKKSSTCVMDENCVRCMEIEKEKQEARVIKFLMGLNESNGLIRTHIIALKELPNLNATFDAVSQEETHRKITSSISAEASAMYVNNQYRQVHVNNYEKSESQVNSNGGGRGRAKVVCTHCNIPGHTKENCYKLIGYPENFQRGRGRNNYGRGRGNNRGGYSNGAFSVQNDTNVGSENSNNKATDHTPQLSADQINQLLALLKPPGPEVNDGNKNHALMAGMICVTALSDNDAWIVDSGATNHFTYDINVLTELNDLDKPCYIRLPNGTNVEVTKMGNCQLKNGIWLKGVLLVPQFKFNLLSVSKLVSDSRYLVTFTDNGCIIQDSQRKNTLKIGEKHGGLYIIEGNQPAKKNKCDAANVGIIRKVPISVWHYRLGHMNLSRMKQYLTSVYPDVKCNDIDFNCQICPLAKQTRLKFPLSNHKSTEIFQMIHCDVWGPFSIETINGSRYFLTVVDDFSRAIWTFLMKSKSDVGEIIIQFFAMVKNQFKKDIRTLRSDNGSEFFNGTLRTFLLNKGVTHQSSCAYTPQQNGIAERKHRHILEVARALRFQSNVSKYFWGDCVLTATYLINRTPSDILKGKTPYEILFGEAPPLNHLRSFGCLCFVINTQKKDKFDARADRCIFLGYPYAQKGYKVYSLNNNRVIISRDVIFHEKVFPFQQLNDSESGVENKDQPAFKINEILNDEDFNETDELCDTSEEILNENPDALSPVLRDGNENEIESFDQPQPGQVPLRRSERLKKSPPWQKDFVMTSNTCRTSPHQLSKFIGYSACSDSYKHFLAHIDSIVEPTSFSQAAKNEKWMEAMKAEIQALENNDTWTLDTLPFGKSAVDCKWVYKIKHNSDGSIERFKARLVAKGFTQIEGLDYHETFAPVIKINTIRCVLAIAAVRNWPLQQLDINNAFLHGVLDEEVYMKTPSGFYMAEKKKGLVCKLNKSIYGLKQASRQWFCMFADTIISYGFVQSLHDYSLFTMCKDGQFLALLVYVDDVILTGESLEMIQKVKGFIHDKFRIKDIGNLKYFLGLEVARSSAGIFLNQRKYCKDLLSEYNFEDCRPVVTPMEVKHSLALSTAAPLADPMIYRRLVGKLIYLSYTRPDLAHPVHVLSQFLQLPTLDHLQAAHRVLRYLKNAPGQGLIFSSNSSLNLTAYCDADWATCPITRRSVSGYCMLLGTALVSWKTKKQGVVSRSSAESEYRSMASACSEISWLIGVLSDLRVTCSRPVHLFCDNHAALHLSRNPVFHERTKHVEIDLHFIRDRVSSGLIATCPVSTFNQLADLFTKPMTAERLRFFLGKLGVSNFLHSPA